MASTSHTHPHGKPINVLKFGEGKKIIVEKPELEKMFMHQDIKNRKVVVVSIIGAFRKGKSFFLDYCLRFLYANYPSINFPKNPTKDPKNWMGEETEPLQGFTWRAGTKRDTTGIIMWSDVFLHTVANTGDKIAIVLMDTQGLFDSETSPVDNSRIFALGTLISSIQILNLMQMIQEDQLQYLQFATEFAKFASRDSQGTAGKPFQNLLFLIRDWQNPEEHPYGKVGGSDYLKTVLKMKSGQKEELKSVREYIDSSFEKIECSLMPHPGKVVAGSKDYDGQWKDMDGEFKAELITAIENLLAPENLVLKKINGKDLIGSEFKEYIETYFELFQSDTLPEAQSIYESTIEKHMNILIDKCIVTFKNVFVKNKDLLSRENLQVFYETAKEEAFKLFQDEKKMGTPQHETKYRDELNTKMDKLFREWSDEKNKSIEQVKAEIAKTEIAIAEKTTAEGEVLKAVGKTEEKQAELDTQLKNQLIDKENYDIQAKLNASRLEVEREKARAVKAEMEKDKAVRENLELQMQVRQMQSQPKGGC